VNQTGYIFKTKQFTELEQMLSRDQNSIGSCQITPTRCVQIQGCSPNTQSGFIQRDVYRQCCGYEHTG
ncbi:MAG: hypothetical protein ACE5NJ_00185, partial [Thermodesulfobacteriota bacterium]